MLPLVGTPPSLPCRICAAVTEQIGTRHGAYSGRDYTLRRCPECRFAFIADPWTQFDQIYDDRYYAGQGADPLVDYEFELSAPQETVRVYEWQGVAQIVRGLAGERPGQRWLDFGAGNGGLVRYVNANAGVDAEGFEDGSIVRRARELGIPIHSSMTDLRSDYDVVTAIEVLEHVLDPVAELKRIRSLMRLGGLLLLTTGNAAPFAADLARWTYVIPEIHVSFFEPITLQRALHQAGFRTTPMPPADGFDQVLKFKVLKNLRVRRRSRLTDLVPSRPVAALADRRVHLRDHPVAWAV
jgi:2-polyprenyl-3-methyl-5-hydroxy-6-metoxy-1,4-benzoquinol methylase